MEFVDELDHTSWLKVRTDGPCKPWSLRLVTAQPTNFAAFSNLDFKMGERILVEMPTVTVTGWHPYDLRQIEEITSRVNNLSERDRRAFYDLTNVFPEIDPVAVGIFMTNSFDMQHSPIGKESAMYNAIARLNHSCTPNAQQTHYPISREEVLYASRNIRVGEEINDCYIDLRQPRSARRKELFELYRFECNCPACAEEDLAIVKNDDNNRVRAKQLDSFVISAAEIDPYNALDIALESVKLLEKAECLPWSIRYVADAHLTVYYICKSINKIDLSRKHLEIAHQHNVLLQGIGSPDSQETLGLLSSLSNNLRKSKLKSPKSK